MSVIRHIVLVSGDDPDRDVGGIAAHVRGLALALPSVTDAAIDLIVLTRRPSAQPGHRVTGGRATVGRIHRIEGGRGPAILRRQMRTRSLASAVERLRDEGPGGATVVHAHDLLASNTAVARIRKRDESVRWVWTNHSSGFLSHVDSYWWRKRMRWEFRRLDGLIAPSAELLTEGARVAPQSAHQKFIPNGVDVASFRLDEMPRSATRIGPPGQPAVIFCPRRVVHKNGIDVLVHAAARLRQEGIPFELRLAGTGASADNRYLGEVRQKARDLDVSSHLVELGDLDAYGMKREYAHAHVAVFPSRKEAISIAALEAMASCTPVVASDVGGLSQLISAHETGLLVEADSPQQLADAIRETIEDETSARTRAEHAAHMVASRYDWRVIADEVLSFYQGLF